MADTAEIDDTREAKNDSFTYLDTDGNRKSAQVVVVYDRNGDPVNTLKIMARDIVIEDGVTVVGWQMLLDEDRGRTGLVVRNDSDVKMYLSTTERGGGASGYPLDAGRGYAFEAFGMLPSNQIWIYSEVAGKHWALMMSTTTVGGDSDA